MKVEELVNYLNLSPHPEGGFYKEAYRSAGTISKESLPEEFGGDRNFATAIYFLIEKNNFSALHKIKSDETWHFYSGDALEVIEINEQGELKITLVGNKMDEGQVFQYTVKANTWFGSRVQQGGECALVGCTVAPGFNFADFEMAGRHSLISLYPQHKTIVEEMTR
ncbi:hypothetical protein CNR22_22465 [Sphingobacteriaceae bacterium]|nr:hypothetical protein CNR22_22465 [Sphingobacteriaceae bacterium]